MGRRLKEWLSVQVVKNPGNTIVMAIMLFNVFFFLASAGIISALSLDGTEKMNFIEAAFCTITMILDAGCISYVVEDIGKSGVGITLICLFVIIVGMISFTGTLIGYVTNYISHFIENSNAGKRKLFLSNHFVILNWNTRASEIVNDMLYCGSKEKIVVLVPGRKEEIQSEIEERLADTIARENAAVRKQYAHLPFIARKIAIRKHKFHKNITVIVREGDVFSSKQLNDISLERARSIIILGNDINNTICKFEHKELLEDAGKGNAQTIKTLMQVADITAAESSFNDQRIIVEITDEWTWKLVEKIIEAKQVEQKCNIIPVRVNEVLGQILSQFCLMPELNYVYSELFSNRGSEFYSFKCEKQDEQEFVSEYLKTHNHALPITIMEKDGKHHAYYVAESGEDIEKKDYFERDTFNVNLNKAYEMETKNIIILGHNSKCKNIMAGFESFSKEWREKKAEIVRIMVIDDKKSLEKMNYYKDYSFVEETVEADIYEKEKICDTINRFVSTCENDTSILILSDDSALNENIDANALASLIYVRDIIKQKVDENPDFDIESIDVIVEIIDPKHHDIVNSYSVNNVVISNRYISKMVTQISEVEEIFDFYNDILSYDEDVSDGFSSKEVYIKKVSRYFSDVPEKTTADQLVRAVYEASVEDKANANPTIVLGYVKPGGIVDIFGGDLSEVEVELNKNDKLILFSAH
ncbi:MAG: hypothetical protein J6D06_06900 [Clostridia bacterium]|nr:hypothetical protein [Clostridia bacterium]